MATKGTKGIVNSAEDLYHLVTQKTGKSATQGAKQAEQAPVEVKISKSKYPESAKHIEDAQKNGHPDELTIKRDNAKANRKGSIERK